MERRIRSLIGFTSSFCETFRQLCLCILYTSNTTNSICSITRIHARILHAYPKNVCKQFAKAYFGQASASGIWRLRFCNIIWLDINVISVIGELVAK